MKKTILMAVICLALSVGTMQEAMARAVRATIQAGALAQQFTKRVVNQTSALTEEELSELMEVAKKTLTMAMHTDAIDLISALLSRQVEFSSSQLKELLDASYYSYELVAMDVVKEAAKYKSASTIRELADAMNNRTFYDDYRGFASNSALSEQAEYYERYRKSLNEAVALANNDEETLQALLAAGADIDVVNAQK